MDSRSEAGPKPAQSINIHFIFKLLVFHLWVFVVAGGLRSQNRPKPWNNHGIQPMSDLKRSQSRPKPYQKQNHKNVWICTVYGCLWLSMACFFHDFRRCQRQPPKTKTKEFSNFEISALKWSQIHPEPWTGNTNEQIQNHTLATKMRRRLNPEPTTHNSKLQS